MKIGILTLPFNNNYGGLLQSYALQTFLKECGHDVWLIKRVVNKPTLTGKAKNLIKKILFLEPAVIDFFMKDFENQYMQKTEIIDRPNKYGLLYKYNFDAYIVGSDQVWRFRFAQDRKKEYFFDFISYKNVNKISFAASFGIDTWDADEILTSEISKLIHNFSAVSVREKSGINLCEKYLKYKEAVHLFDPTLLHSAGFYRQLYTGKETDNSGKIGVYLLDVSEQKKDIVANFEKKIGKCSLLIGKYSKGKKVCYPTVQQWLKDFDTADYIITDSFHGMVFSIIYQKSFCVIGNTFRGVERFTSLLEDLNLQNRLLNLEKCCDYYSFLAEIDYVSVNNVINKNRQRSLDFITKSLCKND